MNSKLYVGNLPFTTTDEELQDLFGAHGTVVSANVISDRETGRSRGFGFVEFDSADSAEAAQQALNGQELDGRALRVDAAQERQRKPSRY